MSKVALDMGNAEVSASFDCFGSSCAVFATGDGREMSARETVDLARARLLEWHARFSRFLPDSELCSLNGDPRREVSVSALMARFADAVRMAGELTDGLVDATLIKEIQNAGYAAEMTGSLPLAAALELAPPRRPAAPKAGQLWRHVEGDLDERTVTRPPGVKLDSGGIAKGLFADVLARALSSHPSFAINCGGDLAIGGSASVTRPINVESPFDGRTLHTFELQRTGVATSGIGRRSWLDERGDPAHHLLDPSTGKPAYTGIVQVTALAPSALLAEIYSKAAILSGPRGAARWLRHGGVIVFDDGSYRIIEPPALVTLGELSVFAKRPPIEAREDATPGRARPPGSVVRPFVRG
jgi:FAD:protein FMN transferase